MRSADLLARGPLVITFYRGVWCPYCNMDLQALEDAADEIRALGASLVAISPQTAPNRRKSERENALSFPILSDHGNALADKFGLRFRLPDDLIAVYKGFGNDLAVGNGEPSWTLPMPARYVIDSNGVIAYAEVNADYTKRPDPSELFPVLRRLQRGAAA
jgi:peroxiredoxin